MKLITLTSLCLSLSKVDVILGQINSANFNQYQITQLILWVTYEKDPSFLTTNFSAVNLLLNFDKHGCWCKSTNPNSHRQDCRIRIVSDRAKARLKSASSAMERKLGYGMQAWLWSASSAMEHKLGYGAQARLWNSSSTMERNLDYGAQA